MGLFPSSGIHEDLFTLFSRERKEGHFCKGTRVTQEKIKIVKGQIIWIEFEPLEQGQLESEAEETIFGRVLVNL